MALKPVPILRVDTAYKNNDTFQAKIPVTVRVKNMSYIYTKNISFLLCQVTTYYRCDYVFFTESKQQNI